MNPCFETATRLARAIRNGRLSSVEATQAHLERIERLNGPLNARSKKDRLGPLHCVPIIIKEAFDVAGHRTTSSYPPLKDNVAAEGNNSAARR